MALDGLAVFALAEELQNCIYGGRIDKITQHSRDEFIVHVRANGENLRLFVGTNASLPRVHITNKTFENLNTPTAFCMMLRKYLRSGHVLSITQPQFDRALIIEIESGNEMGDLSRKNLIIEIMGRYSNIILTDSTWNILGASHPIGVNISSVRQIIPGDIYTIPPAQGKISPLGVGADTVLEMLNKHTLSDKAILSGFTGISPIVARELSYQALGCVSVLLEEADEAKKRKLAEYITNYFDNLKASPVILTKKDSQAPFDFSAVPVTQYENAMDTKHVDSISEAIELFYHEKATKNSTAQRGAETLKLVNNNIARCERKIGILNKELWDSNSKDQYKEIGDIITANIYSIADKSERVELLNYYTNTIQTIKLDSSLSPGQNAQKYYSKYQKYKNAEVALKKQLEINSKELKYLLSVRCSLEQADSEQSITEIRNELMGEGYLKRRSGKKGNRSSKPLKPLEYTLKSGLKMLVGRNNTQNDQLTLKMAKKTDIWFHIKDAPGAHAVLSLDGGQPSDEDFFEAAVICARHSGIAEGIKAPIDYTTIKNVRKLSGAKPGMVIYENYNTIIVQ